MVLCLQTDILRTKGLLSSVDNEDNDLKNEEKIAWMKNVDQEKAEWDALDLMKHAGIVLGYWHMFEHMCHRPF